VNVVAYERFQSTIGQGSYGVATAAGATLTRVGANYLRIRGDTRFSFDADYRHSGALFERERDLLQADVPFDLMGNVLARPGAPGGEIDPALSRLAGSAVTVAAVPHRLREEGPLWQASFQARTRLREPTSANIGRCSPKRTGLRSTERSAAISSATFPPR
jgi:hypothetical protein